MSKEGFNWKGLFVNDSDDQPTPKNTEPVDYSTETKFPSSQPTPSVSNTSPNPFINEIAGVYEAGFNSLNQADFDFFELYKSVMAVGPTNPQSYQMAFTMGKTIKGDLTKEFLIEKSKFYVDEIEKVHAKYEATGNTRKHDLDISITRTKVNLTKAVSDLETQISQLQAELESKKKELSKIDADNMDQYTEIHLKMEANNYAKQKIVDSINQVVSGINQYL